MKVTISKPKSKPIIDATASIQKPLLLIRSMAPRKIERISKTRGIRYAGKALGRPKKVTEQNREQLKRDKQQRQADYRQRIPIEGKFGQGKRAYGLNLIQAKTARTSEAWINSIFLVMNLLVLLRHFLCPQ